MTLETQYAGRLPGVYPCPGFPLGNKCPPAASYKVVTTTALLRYPETSGAAVLKVLNDPLLDDVRVIVRDDAQRIQFLKNFRANRFFGKTKVYITELDDTEFIRRWLGDQRVLVVR